MKVTPDLTLRELMTVFPRGFAIGPSNNPEEPGTLSRIIFGSSHLAHIAGYAYETGLVGNQGYLVVDIDAEDLLSLKVKTAQDFTQVPPKDVPNPNLRPENNMGSGFDLKG